MKESEQHVDRIKRAMQKVDKQQLDKKLAAKLYKAKHAMASNANQKLIGELKARK